MQVNVVRGTSPQIFNAVMFPELAQETQSWLHSQFERGMEAIGEAGRSFVQRAVDLSKQYFSSTAAKAARSIVRDSKSKNTMHIEYCETPEQLQQANRVTQRYLMGNPVARNLYHKQLCDGYSDSYVDLQPGVVGEYHYEFRRVMHNVVQERGSEETGDYEWFAVSYQDELYEGDRQPDPIEQHIVLRGWALMEAMVDAKMDPTDIFNGKLEV